MSFYLETVVPTPAPQEPIRLRVDLDPNEQPALNAAFSVNGCPVRREAFAAIVAMLSLGRASTAEGLYEDQARHDRFHAEMERRVREETESMRKRYEETHRVLCERNSEIGELKRSNDALVRALGQVEGKT